MNEKLHAMDREIKKMREAAQELRRLALECGMPAGVKNADRILASLAMLALHVSDPLSLSDAAEEASRA